MISKKNKYLIFLIFNIFLLLLILLLSIPLSKFLNRINLQDNEFVKNQIIINPELESPNILDRSLKIDFVAKVDEKLNWEFKPMQKNLSLKIGENKIIKYLGKNLSNKTITSTADFFVTPDGILPYLIKTECFCFTEQTLESGESKIFTMVFYIDPLMDLEKNLDDLEHLVFTYAFSEYKS